MRQTIGQCRFCSTVGLLVAGHILPAWAFRRALRRSPGATPILLEGGTRRRSNDQDREPMLCRRCDGDIFGRWDDHASRLAIQPDGSAPAFEKTALPGHGSPGAEMRVDGAVLGHELALFAASVVWRASVSSGHPGKLGPYEDEFRAFLQGRMPDLKHARLLVYVVDPRSGPLAAEVAAYPATYASDGGGRVHQFMVPGLRFVFLVGKTKPARFDVSCFLLTKSVLLTDGADVASFTLRQWQTSTPIGRGWKRAS